MKFFSVGSNIRAAIRPSEQAELPVGVTYHILGKVQESSAFHYIALFPFNWRAVLTLSVDTAQQKVVIFRCTK